MNPNLWYSDLSRNKLLPMQTNEEPDEQNSPIKHTRQTIWVECKQNAKLVKRNNEMRRQTRA